MKHKRLISLIFSIITLVLLSADISYASTEYNASILDGCSSLCYDSNAHGAFACGFNADKVCAVSFMPEFSARSVSVSGYIRSVKQSGQYTYALVHKDVVTDYYILLELNNTDGSCKYYDIKGEQNLVIKYFSVSDGSIYLLKSDDLYAYVKRISLSSGKTQNFKFNNENVTEIFNNNGNTYARLYDGSIYKLTPSGATYCASIRQSDKFSNAGVNYICTNGGTLVSLTDGSKSSINAAGQNCVSVSSGRIYYINSGMAYVNSGDDNRSASLSGKTKAVLSFNGQSVLLTTDNTAVSLPYSDYRSAPATDNPGGNVTQQQTNPTSDYKINSNGVLYPVESGTTVLQFKKSFSYEVKVYDSGGNEVTSGKMKTGYRAGINGMTYSVAVRGDITGEGNVKSNDTAGLMEYLADITNLSDAFLTASDYNLDGTTDNRDLVLISRNTQ